MTAKDWIALGTLACAAGAFGLGIYSAAAITSVDSRSKLAQLSPKIEVWVDVRDSGTFVPNRGEPGWQVKPIRVTITNVGTEPLKLGNVEFQMRYADWNEVIKDGGPGVPVAIIDDKSDNWNLPDSVRETDESRSTILAGQTLTQTFHPVVKCAEANKTAVMYEVRVDRAAGEQWEPRVIRGFLDPIAVCFPTDRTYAEPLTESAPAPAPPD